MHLVNGAPQPLLGNIVLLPRIARFLLFWETSVLLEVAQTVYTYAALTIPSNRQYTTT